MSAVIVWLLVGGELVKCRVEGTVADMFITYDNALRSARKALVIGAIDALIENRTKYAAAVVMAGHYTVC